MSSTSTFHLLCHEHHQHYEEHLHARDYDENYHHHHLCHHIHHNNDHGHCSGPEERVCQATGMWSNQEPYCKKKGWHSDNHQDDDFFVIT